jgi:tetraacyldisaccharide 4'-kinase
MILMKILSLFFGLIVLFRNRLYDLGFLRVQELPGIVISIGNIALGGTGKSPLVIDVARRVIAAGGKPAIVTRGYRSGLGGREWQVLIGGRVVMGMSSDGAVADEAKMQSLALPTVPVIVGVRRFQVILKFLTSMPEARITHFILDDGFQHRRLRRDQDIVVIDARSPEGPLLPAGPFRESLASLRRAHDVVLTKGENEFQVSDSRDRIRKVAPHIRQYELRLAPEPLRPMTSEVSELPERLAAIAGIARPEDFVRSLAEVGIHPVERFFSGDHQSFHVPSIQAKRGSFNGIVTTEKDWARDEIRFRALGLPVYVLPLRPVWVGPGVGICMNKSH